jgi:hypothetical protein
MAWGMRTGLIELSNEVLAPFDPAARSSPRARSCCSRRSFLLERQPPEFSGKARHLIQSHPNPSQRVSVLISRLVFSAVAFFVPRDAAPACPVPLSRTHPSIPSHPFESCLSLAGKEEGRCRRPVDLQLPLHATRYSCKAAWSERELCSIRALRPPP